MIGLGQGEGAGEDPHGFLLVVVLGQAHPLVQQRVDPACGVAVPGCVPQVAGAPGHAESGACRGMQAGVGGPFAGDAGEAFGGTWASVETRPSGVLSLVRTGSRDSIRRNLWRTQGLRLRSGIKPRPQAYILRGTGALRRLQGLVEAAQNRLHLAQDRPVALPLLGRDVARDGRDALTGRSSIRSCS